MRYSFFIWLVICVVLGQRGLEELFTGQLPLALTCLGGALIASTGLVRAFVEGVFATSFVYANARSRVLR